MPPVPRIDTSGGRNFPSRFSGAGPTDPLDHSDRGAVVRPTTTLNLSRWRNQVGNVFGVLRNGRDGGNIANRANLSG